MPERLGAVDASQPPPPAPPEPEHSPSEMKADRARTALSPLSAETQERSSTETRSSIGDVNKPDSQTELLEERKEGDEADNAGRTRPNASGDYSSLTAELRSAASRTDEGQGSSRAVPELAGSAFVGPDDLATDIASATPTAHELDLKAEAHEGALLTPKASPTIESTGLDKETIEVDKVASANVSDSPVAGVGEKTLPDSHESHTDKAPDRIFTEGPDSRLPDGWNFERRSLTNDEGDVWVAKDQYNRDRLVFGPDVRDGEAGIRYGLVISDRLEALVADSRKPDEAGRPGANPLFEDSAPHETDMEEIAESYLSPRQHAIWEGVNDTGAYRFSSALIGRAEHEALDKSLIDEGAIGQLRYNSNDGPDLRNENNSQPFFEITNVSNWESKFLPQKHRREDYRASVIVTYPWPGFVPRSRPNE